MTHMRRLLGIVESADAPLYHGTTYQNALAILASNTIEARTSHFLRGPNNKSTKGVSLSRNWRMSGGWGAVMFELDQRRLRYENRVEPANYGQQVAARDAEYLEAEEFVVGPIHPLSRYLLTFYVRRVMGRFQRDLVDRLMRHEKAVLVNPP